jgi:hypothetical protein
VTRTAPRGRAAALTVVPLLAGATAAAAAVLLLGWPHRPPLPGQAGELAAAVLVAVALLLVFVPALPSWRRAPELPHASATRQRVGEHLDLMRSPAQVSPARRQALEPAR